MLSGTEQNNYNAFPENNFLLDNSYLFYMCIYVLKRLLSTVHRGFLFHKNKALGFIEWSLNSVKPVVSHVTKGCTTSCFIVYLMPNLQQKQFLSDFWKSQKFQYN